MSERDSTLRYVVRGLAAITVIVALLVAPVPLLPPHFWAEKVRFFTGFGWKAAYLIAAIILQVAFYFAIGALAAFVVKRAATSRRRLLQIVVVPVVVITAAFIIRSLKMGHFPVWVNAVIPIGACIVGVWLGLGVLYRRGLLMIIITASAVATACWALSGTITSELTRTTEHQLQKLITNSKNVPVNDARFKTLLQIAFDQQNSKALSAVEYNRATLLALGIALGDERLARFVDLHQHKSLLKQAAQLRKGTTLQARNDWSQHFCMSAALAVLENPLVSDAGGLMKEQLDALSGGSGFSFGDLAADRAGVRFAMAATRTEDDALAMQAFLKQDIVMNDFLPPDPDLPENLSAKQFRKKYGTTGSETYREQINAIETRLNDCRALSPMGQGQ